MKISVGNHEEIMEFAVSGLGKRDLFLGHDWLYVHNPEIDWTEKQIHFMRCPGECYPESEVLEPEDEGESYQEGEDVILAVHVGCPELQKYIPMEPIRVRVKTGFAMEIAITNPSKNKSLPKEYLPY
jgi:hypothetical protein